MLISAVSSDRWPDVRRRAANALGARCQRQGPANALTSTVLKDKDLMVRGDALIALVQCRAPGIADLLPKLWDDGNTPTPLRSQAVGLAAALGETAGDNRSRSGWLRSTAASVSEMVSPSKARVPLSISYSTHPNAQMSARLSTGCPRACSGDM